MLLEALRIENMSYIIGKRIGTYLYEHQQCMYSISQHLQSYFSRSLSLNVPHISLLQFDFLHFPGMYFHTP